MVHSTPKALCPHIEGAAEGVLGMPVHLDWQPQPALPGSLHGQLEWSGPEGTGARLASTFCRWGKLHFEVVQDAFEHGEGHRWCHTPRLGVFHAATDAFGEITVPEERLRAAMLADAQGSKPLRIALDELLGTPWDAELENFRAGVAEADIRWLHQVG